MKIRETQKVVVMGSGGVGKTSLVMQFLDGFFSSSYKPTIEDYYRHTVQMPGKLRSVSGLASRPNFSGCRNRKSPVVSGSGSGFGSGSQCELADLSEVI